MTSTNKTGLGYKVQFSYKQERVDMYLYYGIKVGDSTVSFKFMDVNGDGMLLVAYLKVNGSTELVANQTFKIRRAILDLWKFVKEDLAGRTLICGVYVKEDDPRPNIYKRMGCVEWDQHYVKGDINLFIDLPGQPHDLGVPFRHLEKPVKKPKKSKASHNNDEFVDFTGIYETDISAYANKAEIDHYKYQELLIQNPNFIEEFEED